MRSSAPSLRELHATVPLASDDEAETHRWAKERWTAIHERAKRLAEENEIRRASIPPPPPPSSRSPQPTLRRRRFASESTREALQIMRRRFSSAPPPSSAEPPLSRRWIVLAVVVLAIDLVLVVGSAMARHGWPF